MGNQHLTYQKISRKGILNIITILPDYANVDVYNITGEFKGSVKVDHEQVEFTTPMRMTADGYLYLCVGKKKAVSHIVMNHVSNLEYVVDHISGDRGDNRRSNLRVVSMRDNANNRNKNPKNNTGKVGVSKRKHPRYNYEYYRATVSDRTTPMGGAVSKTKQISKHFNIKKYGDELAFHLACEWLDIKKKEFGYLD